MHPLAPKGFPMLLSQDNVLVHLKGGLNRDFLEVALLLFLWSLPEPSPTVEEDGKNWHNRVSSPRLQKCNLASGKS